MFVSPFGIGSGTGGAGSNTNSGSNQGTGASTKSKFQHPNAPVFQQSMASPPDAEPFYKEENPSEALNAIGVTRMFGKPQQRQRIRI